MKWTSFLLLLPVFLLSCSEPEQPRLEPIAESEISGQRLWIRISEESEFADWSYWPGHEELQPGQSPHGKFHAVYINYILEEALPISSGTVPKGMFCARDR
jgi:hypothetical protein